MNFYILDLNEMGQYFLDIQFIENGDIPVIIVSQFLPAVSRLFTIYTVYQLTLRTHELNFDFRSFFF